MGIRWNYINKIWSTELFYDKNHKQIKIKENLEHIDSCIMPYNSYCIVVGFSIHCITSVEEQKKIYPELYFYHEHRFFNKERYKYSKNIKKNLQLIMDNDYKIKAENNNYFFSKKIEEKMLLTYFSIRKNKKNKKIELLILSNYLMSNKEYKKKRKIENIKFSTIFRREVLKKQKKT